MKLISAFAILLAMFSMAPRQAHAQQIKMLQCEDCSSLNVMKGTATARGPGDWVVFSLKHELITRYKVEYDGEFDRLWTWPMMTPASVEDAFALMLEVDAEKPRFFSSGQQDFQVDINKLGGGPHNPVSISLNGEHDSAYGSFISHARSCLSSVGCANSLDSTLGKLVHADQKLNGAGISIMGVGGNISWENLPPGVDLWLCDSNNDCALLTYDKDTGKWEYVETRAEGGNGKRYPKYGESLNYRFNGSDEVGIFNRGLRDGGATVTGTWTLKTVLACVDTGGIMRCEYITYPE